MVEKVRLVASVLAIVTLLKRSVSPIVVETFSVFPYIEDAPRDETDSTRLVINESLDKVEKVMEDV